MQGEANHEALDIRCSVIICVRNGARTLRAQLFGLSAQQDAPPFEVIVVDNGSTDTTTDVYHSWADGDIGCVSTTRLIDAASRPGLAYARNRGAAAATGGVLAFCDADDLVSANWVAAACSAVLSGHAAVGGQVRRLAPDGQPLSETLMDSLDGISPTQGARHPYPFFWGCNFALHRDAFEAVGGFDESLPPYGCDDIDIGVRLGQRGIHIGYAADMVVYYTPPSGLRRRLRRKFQSGVAQACLWQRHPDTYVERSLTGLVTTLPRALVDALETTQSTRMRLLRVSETVASRAGQAWGLRSWVQSGRLGPAQYFGVDA